MGNLGDVQGIMTHTTYRGQSQPKRNAKFRKIFRCAFSIYLNSHHILNTHKRSTNMHTQKTGSQCGECSNRNALMN